MYKSQALTWRPLGLLLLAMLLGQLQKGADQGFIQPPFLQAEAHIEGFHRRVDFQNAHLVAHRAVIQYRLGHLSTPKPSATMLTMASFPATSA